LIFYHPSPAMSNDTTSRRAFLRNSTVAAAAVAAVAACQKQSAPPAVTQQGSATGGSMGGHDTGTGAAVTLSAADKMDAMHEAGVKAFPAKTAIWGNQVLAPTIVGGVKVFNLSAKVV